MRLHHIGILAEDMEKAIRNHREIFGLHQATEIVEDPIQRVRVVMLAPEEGGIPVEIITPSSRDSPINDLLKGKIRLYHLCYEVDDLDEALELTRRAKARVISGPSPAELFHGGRIAFIFSPDGYVVELLEQRRESKG